MVQSTLLDLHGTESYSRCEHQLSVLLAGTRDAVVELEQKIEFQLTRIDSTNAQKQAKVASLSWLKAAHEIERMRSRIANARANLNTGLLAVNVQIRSVVTWPDSSLLLTILELG
jgi:hypothetical protein